MIRCPSQSGYAPRTWSGSASTDCGAGRCEPCCPLSASPSGSRPWSRVSASAPSAGPGLLAQIQQLGTNLLTVAPGAVADGAGRQVAGRRGRHGRADPRRHRRCPRVGLVPSATVRRTDRIDSAMTSGIAVQAARHDLLDHPRRHRTIRHVPERRDRPVPDRRPRRGRRRPARHRPGRRARLHRRSLVHRHRHPEQPRPCP